MFSSGGWAFFAFPAGFLLILASIDTVNIGLILVGSFFIAGLIFVYLLDITEEDILGGFLVVRWQSVTLWLTYTSYGIESIPFFV